MHRFETVRDDQPVDLQAALLAAGISLCLHLVLIWVLPTVFHHPVLVVHPVQVLTAPVPFAETRLPPVLRYAETNSAANRAQPLVAPFVASRNQVAAQPVPEKTPTKSSLPKSLGTENTIRVAQGKPRSIDSPESVSAEGQAGTASAAVGPMPGKPVEAKPLAPPSAAPRDPERPKATVSSGTTGLILKNNIGVGRAGVIAIDARFSIYGDYTQRMMEAIQSSWWDIIDRSRFETMAQGRVVVRFKLHRDGTVTDAQILWKDVPNIMAFACKDSVMAPAPFDVWRPDMVALFGEEDTVTVSFHYR